MRLTQIEAFEEDYLKLHREYTKPHITKREVEAVLSYLGVGKESLILDAGCGQGRHLRELLDSGHIGIGIDQSDYLLGIAKAEFSLLPTQVLKSNIIEIPLTPGFDAIISLFTAFGFFESPEEDLAAIKEFFRLLNGNGILLIETINGNRSFSEVKEISHPHFRIVQEKNSFDKSNNVLSQCVTFEDPEGRTGVFQSKVRTYTPETFVKLFEAAGFVDIEISSGLPMHGLDNTPGFQDYQTMGQRISCKGRKPLTSTR